MEVRCLQLHLLLQGLFVSEEVFEVILSLDELVLQPEQLMNTLV